MVPFIVEESTTLTRLSKVTELEITKNEYELGSDSRACLLSHSAILPPCPVEWFLYFCPSLDILPATPALPNPADLIAHALGIVLTGNKRSKSRSLPHSIHYALEEERGVSLKGKEKMIGMGAM